MSHRPSLMPPLPYVAALAAVFLAAAPSTQPATRVTWDDVLRQPEGWYATEGARAIADSVLLYQRASGGWPKNIDMTVPPDAASLAAAAKEIDSTIDNGATTTQLRFLARIVGADAGASYRRAVLRGIDYLLAAQYPNGGWPQYFPLRTNYSRHITFNDDAMVHVLELLSDVAAARAPFAFVDPALRSRAGRAADAGADLILRAQITVDGTLTAWCAQHDEVTLEPRGARTYEHPSLSGQESVGIIRFLMSRDPPSPRIVAAVDAAVAWLIRVRITGWRLNRKPDPSQPRGYDLGLVVDPSAPTLEARFYPIASNRPTYSGRDGVIKYSLAEIEYERRTGYAWVGTWPAPVLEKEYPAWRARIRAAHFGGLTTSFSTRPFRRTFRNSIPRTASSTSSFSTPSKVQSTIRTSVMGD